MKTTNSIEIDFTEGSVPSIINAGRVNFNDRSFSIRYKLPYASMHLYFYHGIMHLCGNEYHLAPGDITITPPKGESEYDLDEPGMHIYIHFRLPENIRGETMQLPLYFPAGIRNSDAGFLFEEILKFYSYNSKLCKRAANETLKLLLLHLALRLENAEKKLTDLERKLETIRSLLENEPWHDFPIAALSGRVILSPNYLARMFKRKYGMTIRQYRLKLQIERADFLLKYSNLSVKEIGIMVGLPDPQYFNKRFRMLKGISPSAARSEKRPFKQSNS